MMWRKHTLPALAVLGTLCGTCQIRAQDSDLVLSIEEPPDKEAIPRMVFAKSWPRYPTSSIEIRDARGELWPAYFLARASDDEGWFQYGDQQHKGQLSVESLLMAQVDGTQDRRIGGELVQPKEVKKRDGTVVMQSAGPDVLIRVDSLGPVTTEQKTVTRKVHGKEVEKTVSTAYTPVLATLRVNGHDSKVKGRMHVSVKRRKSEITLKEEVVSAPMRFEFRVKGADLGLRTQHADRDVDVRVYTEAFVKGKSKVDVPVVEEGSGSGDVQLSLEEIGFD